MFSACSTQSADSDASHPCSSSYTHSSSTQEIFDFNETHSDSNSNSQKNICYFDTLTQDAFTEMDITKHDDAWMQVKKAFLYVISHTYYIEYDNATLTDSWRYIDTCGYPPSIYEVMATSPLMYGLGSCENYACALMLLLDQMGFKTRYVPGTTYSVMGTMVRHAWVMVRIEDSWYHIDPQLEDNISTDNVIFYYYLKNDAEFSAHHVWGASLEHPTDYDLTLPECPTSINPPQIEVFEKVPQPDLNQSVATANELRDWAGDRAPGIRPDESLPPFPIP